MPRFAIIVAAAVLAGCNTTPPPQERAPVARTMPFQPGTGVVQDAFPAPATSLNRLVVKMDSGPVQYVDTDSRGFTKGTRVTLSENGYIIRQ